MEIGGLQKFNLGGYPNKAACCVFLLGCNFRCPWCDSLDFILPEKMNSLPKVSEKEFFDVLKEGKGAIEAVVISGGEPMHSKDLPDFCQKIKQAGFAIKIETNGSNFVVLGELINKKLVDYISMDIKAPKAKYGQAIGLEDCSINYIVDNIEKSINLIKQSGIDYDFTTVVTPLLQKQDILDIASWIKPAKRYLLKEFRPQKTLDPNFSFLAPISEEYLASIKQSIAPFFG